MKRRKKDNKRLHIAALVTFLLAFSSMLTIEVYATERGKEEYSLIDENMEGILSDFEITLPFGMESFAEPYNSSGAVGPAFLIENAISVVNGQMGEFLSFFISLFGVSLLMGIASLREGEAGKTAKNTVFIVASALIMDKVFDTVASIGASMREINGFISAVIPVMTAVNTLGVSPGLATSQTLGMSLTLQIYSFLGGDFLYSLSGVMLTFAALTALDATTFGRTTAYIKKTFITVMGVLTTFLGATFALQSMISSSADSGVLRGAKYAISGMIPIVGGSISSALSTLVGGVSYLRGVVGGGGIAVVISLALSPLVTLLAYRCCFNLVILFMGFCNMNETDAVLGAFASVFDALIASYALTAVVYIAQLSVFLKGGAGLA